MATDYFTMMRDVVGSYGDGVDSARKRKYEDEKRAREKVIQGREDATYEREQGQIKDEDAAVQQYGLLTSQGKRNAAGVQANDVDFEKAVQATGQGLPMPAAAPQQPEWTPATDLDRNQGLQGISRARRDWNGVAALQKEEKGLKWDQTFGERMKEYKGTPEQIAEGVSHVNDNSKSLTLGKPGKDGMAEYSITTPGRDAVFGRLSRQDQATLWSAGGMMEMDPTRALTIMAGVNKELAAAIAADNGLTGVMAGIQDKQAGRVETGRHNKVTERNDAVRTQAIVGRTPVGPDPKLVAKYNDLMIQVEEATDPKERAGLDQQMRRVAAQISTQMGKPMQVRAEIGAKGDGSFKESPAAGAIGSVNGQRVQVQADGSYAAPGAETNPAAFVAAKYPDLVQSYPGQFSVTPDGKGLYIGTREDYDRMGGRVTAFDYRNPRDMQELAESLRVQTAGDAQANNFAQEFSKRGGAMPPGRASAQGMRPQVDSGMGPKLTGQRAPEAPSIYASEQEWANYRQYQADKKQTNPR